MADRGDLKGAYAHISAEADETARFRDRLAMRLADEAPKRRFWSPARLVLLPAAAALLILFLPERAPSWTRLSLDALRTYAASPEARAPDVVARARDLAAHADAGPRGKAGALLCLVLPPEEAMAHATASLGDEPDPAVRAFYLEWILDHSDPYRFNAERIEELMETEDDRLCYTLYLHWLKIA